MTSPRDRLVQALQAWLLDDARERLARFRGAPDADPIGLVLQRHAALRGPLARELFEEARERGLLEGSDLMATSSWLREAYATVGRSRADARLADVLGQRVPHDSDHFPSGVLFDRLCREAHVGRRRAFGRSLEAHAPSVLRAMREGLADVEEALEPARWLEAARAPDRAEPSAVLEAARATLRATEDVWAEALERLRHTAATPIETWPDLLHALRAPRLDDLVSPRRRFRRLAEPLDGLGVSEALSRRARVQGVAPGTYRAQVVPLAVPRDVRIVPAGLELGLASERAAAEALGRALALAWTHPALPPLAAWPEASTVGRAVGGLFAHVGLDPLFLERAGHAPREARMLREVGTALELFALRTAAAACEAREHLGASAFPDAARESLRGAWQVDVVPSVAAVVSMPRGNEPTAALRAARWVAPLHALLRERFDEDYWRNPRTAELLRAAAERGPSLTVEAWAAELGASAARLGERYGELMR